MKFRTGVPATLALAMVLAGCGGGAGAPAAPPAAGASDLSGQTVEVTAVWSDEEQTAFETVLAEFESRTGAEVSYTSAGDELPTVLQTRLAGGAPPDVAVIPQPGFVAELARAGSLQPLSAAAESVIDEQYAPVWKELGTVDGALYGLVFKAANKSTVWYDAQALGTGFTPPTDLAGLTELLRTQSDSGATPLSLGAADGWTLTDWFENVYLRTAGPESYDALAAHEIPWTDPTVRTALDQLAQVWQPQYVPGGAESALQTEFTDSVVNVFGDTPSASIVYEGDFVAGVISESTSSVVGEDADYFRFPDVDGASGVVSGGDTVVTLTPNPAAAALVEFLASADAATIWAEIGGFISPNGQVTPDAYPDETTRSIATDLASAETVRFDMSDLMPAAFGGTDGAGFWKGMQDVLADPSQTDAILADLEAQAVTAYAGS
ncbi:MAG: carbohydrate ABC transporter substrate-binding protein [Pseudonocardia sp.]|nr:carbohydrate ABC transporter substrate-binding protein [Pseudonocardia sp.]